MRILVLPSFYPTREKPTLGIFVRDHADLMGAAGHTVEVASVEARSLRALGLGALRITRFQTHHRRTPLLQEHFVRAWNTGAQTRLGALIWIRLARRLAERVASRLRPDVIHAHNALLGGVAATRVGSAGLRIRLLTEHSSAVLAGDLRPWQRLLAKRSYASADAVIAVSHALGLQIRALAPEGTRIEVIPNPIDTEFFQPSVRGGAAGPVFGSICNLVGIKRLDIALEAFAIVHRRHPECRFIVGGHGPELEPLRQLAGRLGILDAVEFTGPLSREEVRSTLNRIGTLCISSRFETFGMIGAEAMAMGIPVITSDCGGPADFVSSDTGLLVKSCEPDAFARAFTRRLEGAHAFDPVRIRNAIVESCSREAVTRRVEELLSSLLEQRLPGKGIGLPDRGV